MKKTWIDETAAGVLSRVSSTRKIGPSAIDGTEFSTAASRSEPRRSGGKRCATAARIRPAPVPHR